MERLRKRYEAEDRKYFATLLTQGIEHLQKSGLLREIERGWCSNSSAR